MKTGGVMGTLKGEYKPEDGAPVLEVAVVQERLLALRDLDVPMEVVETARTDLGASLDLLHDGEGRNQVFRARR